MDVLDHLSSLLDKSLVMKQDVAGTACYRLHETMREYAKLKLLETGDEVSVERRCMDYYRTQCQQFAVEGRHQLVEWPPWVELRIDTIRGVLRRTLDKDEVPAGTEKDPLRPRSGTGQSDQDSDGSAGIGELRGRLRQRTTTDPPNGVPARAP